MSKLSFGLGPEDEGNLLEDFDEEEWDDWYNDHWPSDEEEEQE